MLAESRRAIVTEAAAMYSIQLDSGFRTRSHRTCRDLFTTDKINIMAIRWDYKDKSPYRPHFYRTI